MGITEDHAFSASGPAESQGGVPWTGFSTGYSEHHPFEYGANVQGSKCGVYANVFNGGDRTPPPQHSGLGVCGIGRPVGIYGQGERGRADDKSRPIGVWGLGAENEGIGVRGEGSGRGVLGIALEGRKAFRAGVAGLIGEFGHDLPANSLVRRGGGAGIVGSGGRTGPGTVGLSEGVHPAIVGQSDGKAPGGQFHSGKGAQLHLEPTLTELPWEGTAGDLLAIIDRAERFSSAQLFFCTRSDRAGHAAIWKQLA